MSEYEFRRRRFLEKTFAKERLKTKALVADHQDGILWTDPMRQQDFYDGLPIPCGDDLLVNPFF